MDHAAHAMQASHAHGRTHGDEPADRSHAGQAAGRVAQSPVPTRARVAFSATLHCLTGCAIGEVLGMVAGTALGLDDMTTIVLAVALAFLFGYLLTMLPLLRSGMARAAAVRLALAADTASITLMEIIDNAIMWAIPGAMDAGLDAPLFWGSLAVALLVAGLAAWPVNRWLIARGRGHAVVHAHHAH
jgi:phage-related tail fiber protein